MLVTPDCKVPIHKEQRSLADRGRSIPVCSAALCHYLVFVVVVRTTVINGGLRESLPKALRLWRPGGAKKQKNLANHKNSAD